MREIKFRAWDTGRRMKKGMYSWEEMIESLDSEFNPRKSLFAPFINTPEFQEGQWIKLMQYTGLKDKNGKEIYEGDVLKYVEGQPPHAKTNFEVKWDDEFAMFYAPTPNENLDQTELENEDIGAEVIGNIYENPELLKGVDSNV